MFSQGNPRLSQQELNEDPSEAWLGAAMRPGACETGGLEGHSERPGWGRWAKAGPY